MYMLAEATANHAAVNHTEMEISIQDVRMAMQDCAVLAPEKVMEDQQFDGEEDTRGVDAFIAWALGKSNQDIRRVALEGSDGLQEDYLAGLSPDWGIIPQLTSHSSQKKAQCYRRGL